MSDWSPDSWRRFEARQQPDYPDPAALAAATSALSAYPPLVRLAEIDALKAALAEAQRGRAFLLQGGDCAESFADFSKEAVAANVALIEATAERLADASGLPVVTIGRIAGQFAKPRSEPSEGALPAWRGDIVNGLAPRSEARRPDPERMFRAYAQSAATLAWLPRGLWSSHEALLLPYEQTQVRQEGGRWYCGSAHFLWVGERTAFDGSAHVELLRGLANPIGIKCGPRLAPATLLSLLDRLDPAGEPGRITLIVRMGAERIGEGLPPLMESASGRPVLWVSDPMHGNTLRDAAGIKTRPLELIFAELEAFFAIAGPKAGGMHVEMTGEDVTECGSPGGDTSRCDPRLNRAQALALADLAARIPVLA